MDRKDDDILKVVSHLLETLQQSGVRLTAAYLYGSYAAGTAHPDSDIDVALISEDFTGNWLEDHKRIVSTLLRCDARIELVRFHPEEFRDENPLAWEIKTKGIRLL